MSDVRALDEPLTDAELDELEAFLASDAVPQDCMDLEMLDGYLTAIASGPESIQPSEWLPGVWSEGGRSASPAYGSSEQAQRVMGLMLRHMVGIERTLAESPTRFRPLLYLPDREKGRGERAERPERGGMPSAAATRRKAPPGAKATWPASSCATTNGSRCTTPRTRATGSSRSRRWRSASTIPSSPSGSTTRRSATSLVDELPVAAVLIYRFWQDRRKGADTRTGGKRRTVPDAARKARQRLH